MLIERAPAKINLTLHVNGRRADGYHDLESLVAFSGIADILTLSPGAPLSLDVGGPTAAAAGAIGDNLVLKAERALSRRVAPLRTGAFRLVKRLPAAAGVGGGSSDAAAALRLLARVNDLSYGHPALLEAAAEIGADVPVCLDPHARMMRGAGERLGVRLALPPLFALLVNPGVPVATAPVFTRLGMAPGDCANGAPHPSFPDPLNFSRLLEGLRSARNDLEGPARAIAPAIAHVLAVIGATPMCRLTRMSGSGATCFGLFETRHAAARAARAVALQHPDWWARATALR